MITDAECLESSHEDVIWWEQETRCQMTRKSTTRIRNDLTVSNNNQEQNVSQRNLASVSIN